jgi:ABC-type Mn2+/Zn2+ transport system permease subunit
MTSLLSSPLVEPFTHAFMRNAFAAIILVGLICGVMGVFVILRGLAFIGDAVSHAAFPGLVIDYKRVTVTYTTHSEGGLTEKDFEGAKAATSIAASLGGR